ncbi:hypothetical protein, partial [Serratia marcescens]
MKEELYGLANHIAGAKGGLPQEWQDWANEIETDLRKLANREAQPVAIVEPSDYVTAAQLVGEGPARKAVHELYEGALVIGQHLYAAPPAPAVPDEMAGSLESIANKYQTTIEQAQFIVAGWNARRAAMLAQPVSIGYKLPEGWKLVPVEPTAEMINAALASGALSIRTAYRVMLAAAPEG